MNQDKNVIKSIQKAVRVLEALNECQEGKTFTQLLEDASLSLSKPALARILHTLKEEGLVTYEPDSRKYRLGLKLFEWGTTAADGIGLREIAYPLMKQLSLAVQETVHLGILDGSHVTALEVTEGPSALRSVILKGQETPLYCTGVGKALLAWLPESEATQLIGKIRLERFTPNTITNVPDLMDELSNVRRNGYAVDREEHHPGMTCVAAPVFDKAGVLKASLSVSGPTYRLRDKGIEKIAQKVVDTAREIGSKLPCQVPLVGESR